MISKDYLSLSGAKSQGMKQLIAGGGVALVGTTLVPLQQIDGLHEQQEEIWSGVRGVLKQLSIFQFE